MLRAVREPKRSQLSGIYDESRVPGGQGRSGTRATAGAAQDLSPKVRHIAWGIKHNYTWVVVKIRVPFWVYTPNIRCRIFLRTQKGILI